MNYYIKKKKRNILVEKFQKEIFGIKTNNDSDNKKKHGFCNDFGTRTCLSCSRCWEKDRS